MLMDWKYCNIVLGYYVDLRLDATLFILKSNTDVKQNFLRYPKLEHWDFVSLFITDLFKFLGYKEFFTYNFCFKRYLLLFHN